MLYVFGLKVKGAFEIIELFNCWVIRYEQPKASGKYHIETFYKPNKFIEAEIQRALAELQWQGRGDHWRGKLF